MPRKILLYIIAATACVPTVIAQHSLKSYPPAHGSSSDPSFVIPHTDKPSGQRDQAGVVLLTKYIQAAGADSERGICATGDMSIGPVPGNVVSANLTIGAGDNQQRLDFAGPNGETSIRFSGSFAGIMQNGKLATSLPFSSAKAGLFMTPKDIAQVLAEKSVSVTDNGETRIGNRLLHSVTLSIPLASANSHSRLIPPRVVALYFDAKTDLLADQVEAVSLSEAKPASHLRVIAFESYTQQRSLWPEHISETRDGQLLWSLNLRSVDMSCAKATSFFSTSGGAQ